MADKAKIPTELVDGLLQDYQEPSDLLGPEGLLKQLTAALVERALDAEMTTHLGYEKHQRAGKAAANARNGTGKKTLKTEHGPMTIEVPRDRNGSFDPQLVKKRQTRFDGFDDKIVSMYARGMSVRDVRDHLQELYGVDVSRELISKVTDQVLDEVKAWQSRPLEPLYPIVYMDALALKVRHQVE